MAPLRISLLFYLVATVTFYNAGTVSGELLSKTLFVEGDTVTVTCDAVAVNLDSSYNEITSVELTRQAYSAGSEAVSLCAIDLSAVSFGKPFVTSLPQDGWTYKTPTHAEALADQFSRSVMKITLTMTDTKCTDEGLYKCNVLYRNGPTPSMSVEQSLNATVKATSLTAVLVPDDTFGGSVVPEYRVNDTISMTCHAVGPMEDTFRWTRRCKRDNFDLPIESWPVQNEIKEPTVEKDTNSQCVVYKHSQELSFEVPKNYERCTVFCEFGSHSISDPNLSANFTYQLKGTEPPAGGNYDSSSASSGSSDDLVIGLTVSLLLVAIIVVAVLVYFCWWRKRSPSQDKYKDEPDVGNKNQEVPPVFYSKPHKPPKADLNNVEDGGTSNKALDRSIDSRDSGTGRKDYRADDIDGGHDDYRSPRYINQEPFSTGPPTYNSHEEPAYDPHYDEPPYDEGHANRYEPRSREPYMGHQNTAYDGEPDPEPEGRKYSRGRARSNRTDRLNSSRSTEDGSVVHGLDVVDMGTAI